MSKLCPKCQTKKKPEKIKNTNIEKYGVENPLQNNEIKEKIGNIVLNAFDIMSEANLNENQAIDLIEKEIDQWQQ